ncbi:MAG: fumarylacetoacetase [Chloroflexi bacterium]|nr:MAG: fumarylacetoacetase [Chloroflexota bacterium]MCQ3937096.1 fumarylacetoacetase [Chloroflexota bacterium]MDL1941407.1 fumarylacetoacetase [Chloroflexi bacterium CFX2]
MLKSFIEVPPDSDFPIQNLPYGIFSTKANPSPRVGTRLGDWVIDLAFLDEEKLFGKQYGFFADAALNRFMAAGRDVWRVIRQRLTELLSEGSASVWEEAVRVRALTPASDVKMYLPVAIGDYTDFYASREHATNVGIMFRGKENALMPNWLHLPVGYHGRASSVVVTDTDVIRPRGQVKPKDAPPEFTPTRQLDFELEMGFFVGRGNELGEPISIENAREHIFGMVLLNDWSARDIQAWEYQPLGPFLAKNFATSISPWVVTMDALEPFRVHGPKQEPTPLPYLRADSANGYDIHLEVTLQSARMDVPQTISRSNMKYLYWGMDQMLAHHTVTGCNMRVGDLCGTGTISGPTEDSYGSMLELTWRGEKPIQLPSGETRTFLQDGDIVTMKGYCQGDGYRVGFGEVTGKILPAK